MTRPRIALNMNRLIRLLTLGFSLVMGACATAPIIAITPTIGGRVEALLVNGGDSPKRNVFAHLIHLEKVLSALETRGVDRGAITVLSGDGDDPGLDLAAAIPTRDSGAWRVDGTRYDALLRAAPILTSSTLEGTRLLPARRAALETWFHLRGRALGPGDTLLLYITDHGVRGEIALWNERLTVAELRGLLAMLDPGVAVILSMSQCYSGSFASLAIGDRKHPRRPRTCGIFSTVEDRKAYGCYRHMPEGGLDALDGHGIRFAEALKAGGSPARFNRWIRRNDQTPDVPVQTSALFLRDQVKAAAKQEGIRPEALATQVLRGGWADDPAFAGARLEVGALRAAFGLPPLPTAFAVRTVVQTVKRQHKRLERVAKDWRRRQHAASEKLAAALATARPDLAGRRMNTLTRALEVSTSLPMDERRRAVRRRLAGVLDDLARNHPKLDNNAKEARDKAEHADDLIYDLSVRLGALERVRLIFQARAGRTLIEPGSEAAAILADLDACEGRRFGTAPTEADPTASPTALPPLAELLVAVEALMPNQGTDRATRKTVAVGVDAPSIEGLKWLRGDRPAVGRRQIRFFWATWCAPCKKALPALMARATELDADIIAITSESPETVNAWLKRWTKAFPVRIAVDPTGQVSRDHQGTGLPTFAIVADGVLVLHRTGMPRDGDLRLTW